MHEYHEYEDLLEELILLPISSLVHGEQAKLERRAVTLERLRLLPKDVTAELVEQNYGCEPAIFVARPRRILPLAVLFVVCAKFLLDLSIDFLSESEPDLALALDELVPIGARHIPEIQDGIDSFTLLNRDHFRCCRLLGGTTHLS